MTWEADNLDFGISSTRNRMTGSLSLTQWSVGLLTSAQAAPWGFDIALMTPGSNSAVALGQNIPEDTRHDAPP
jgi:hypothetical protein